MNESMNYIKENRKEEKKKVEKFLKTLMTRKIKDK